MEAEGSRSEPESKNPNTSCHFQTEWAMWTNSSILVNVFFVTVSIHSISWYCTFSLFSISKWKPNLGPLHPNVYGYIFSILISLLRFNTCGKIIDDCNSSKQKQKINTLFTCYQYSLFSFLWIWLANVFISSRRVWSSFFIPNPRGKTTYSAHKRIRQCEHSVWWHLIIH